MNNKWPRSLYSSIFWYPKCDINQSSDPYSPVPGKAFPHLSLSTHCFEFVPFLFSCECFLPFSFFSLISVVTSPDSCMAVVLGQDTSQANDPQESSSYTSSSFFFSFLIHDFCMHHFCCNFYFILFLVLCSCCRINLFLCLCTCQLLSQSNTVPHPLVPTLDTNLAHFGLVIHSTIIYFATLCWRLHHNNVI